MEKKCGSCAHWCICRAWALVDGVCDLYTVAPPCKVGDRLFVPWQDPDDESKWIVEAATVTDVGQRNVYCAGIIDDPDDVSDVYKIDRIGVDIFLTFEEAREYAQKRTKENDKRALAERGGR